jgi:hypothetical protein
MLAILKLIQSLVKTPHSDGTPAQIAGGVPLGLPGIPGAKLPAGRLPTSKRPPLQAPP